jgi:hypothetical protein
MPKKHVVFIGVVACAVGPVCPNGHPSGDGKPMRAVKGEKLACLYEAAGWTNLIRER